MKKEIALAIFHASEDIWEGDELGLRKNYSGRAMYGNTTYGITGYESDYTKAVIACVEEMIQNDDDDEETDDLYDLGAKVREFLDHALNATTDNMGHQTIWY